MNSRHFCLYHFYKRLLSRLINQSLTKSCGSYPPGKTMASFRPYHLLGQTTKDARAEGKSSKAKLAPTSMVNKLPQDKHVSAGWLVLRYGEGYSLCPLGPYRMNISLSGNQKQYGALWMEITNYCWSSQTLFPTV